MVYKGVYRVGIYGESRRCYNVMDFRGEGSDFYIS